MTYEHILAFNIALLAAIASPGPALLVAIRTTLVGGRSNGISIGFGLGLMASLWTGFALLGLDGLFRLFPWAYLAAKIIGAIYLLYIAWSTWKGASTELQDTSYARKNAFRDGFLINVSNPKSVLFAAAVLVVIFPQDLTLLEKGIVVANHFVIEVAFYTILAFLMSAETVRQKYLNAKLYLDRFAAVVLGGLGLKLIFSEK